MQPRGTLRFAAAILVAFLCLGSLPLAASDTGSGRLSPENRLVEWTGGPGAERGRDFFRLEVAVPESYWTDRVGGVSITIDWESRVHDFDLYVFEGEIFPPNEAFITASQAAGTTTEELFLDDPPGPSGFYTVMVVKKTVAPATYKGIARFEANDRALFDTHRRLSFAPSTLVSAQFLGSEPMLTMERPVAGALRGAIDPDRVFVDWPLTIHEGIGQLSRSVDGGDSFRLLFDPACATLSRPNCHVVSGGGDTFSQVDLHDGTLYFADQFGLFAHSLASSTDHGDTWPRARQHSTSNATTAVDRQWIATTDSAEIKAIGGARVDAFLSYAGGGTPRMGIQGIDDSGAPIAQPLFFENVARMGPIRVDATNGPGRGWVYQPYSLDTGSRFHRSTLLPGDGSDIHVATVFGSDYQDPTEWRSNLVRHSEEPENFTWLDLDRAGNAYAVWENDGKVFYSASPIYHPRNNPKFDPPGRPGSYWTPKQTVSLPEVGSAVFAEVTAGDPGRIAIVYDGTSDFTGRPDCRATDEEEPDISCAEMAGARWHTYAAVITNALAEDGPPVVTTGVVSRRVVHRGNICTEGGACGGGEDRSLLDMIDVDHDVDGRVGVTFSDNNSTFHEASGADAPKGEPFSYFAKQIDGPTLSARKPTVRIRIPFNGRTDPSGDATWPDATSGKRLPSLDALGAALFIQGEDLVARVPLAASSDAQIAADLEHYNWVSERQPAARVQYVVRFMTEDDIFHLSMDSTGSARRFFGGRLDSNDGLTSIGTTTRSDIFGVGYRSDTQFRVTGMLKDDTLTIRGKASDFGLARGSSLVNGAAFTMVGPSEQNESLTNPMRTVDATPPFDAILGPSSGVGCHVLGTSDADTLHGTKLAETLCGLGGDDRLIGWAGDDYLRGGSGSDVLRGGREDDTLVGGPGYDWFFGGLGDDLCSAGPREFVASCVLYRPN